MLQGKHILVGVTGGIAAYKVCYLVRELVRGGAEVRVVMTPAATKFVSPMTFSALSGFPVAVDLWQENQETGTNVGVRHIDLATWADMAVVAPATANTVAKITCGMTDNLLTVLMLACRAPVILVPAMDADMYLNPVTLQNLAVLQERGFHVVPPEEGAHASGLHGPGRLPEVETILRFMEQVADRSFQDLRSKRILVTAGPTFEPIDPVRFIGNRSSGKMGFALASAAALRGADVTLVTGPVSLQTPRHVKRVDVETAREMHDAVLERVPHADAVIMAAAVADFTPRKKAAQKIKKTTGGKPPVIALGKTIDILGVLGKKSVRPVLVGFALETERGVEHARAKLMDKNLDLIVLNSLKDEGAGFGTDTNVVTILPRSGAPRKLPKMPKFEVANRILDHVRDLLARRAS